MRLLLISLLLGLAQADPLLVSYIAKPPYYYTHYGQAQGFLLARSQSLFNKAGIAVVYQEKPARRILSELQQADSKQCSLGWFKTPEREKFARFSQPIYQDKPMLVLSRPELLGELTRFANIASLLRDSPRLLGTSDGFSYGPQLDEWLAKMGNKMERSSTSPIITLRKVALGRLDYAIVDADELDWLRLQPGLQDLKLSVVPIAGMPPGRLRYLMCGLAVPPELIERFNRAM